MSRLVFGGGEAMETGQDMEHRMSISEQGEAGLLEYMCTVRSGGARRATHEKFYFRAYLRETSELLVVAMPTSEKVAPATFAGRDRWLRRIHERSGSCDAPWFVVRASCVCARPRIVRPCASIRIFRGMPRA
eukprot:scaffold167833_cov31-Tisochrysis_lutea.AAC.2